MLMKIWSRYTGPLFATIALVTAVGCEQPHSFAIAGPVLLIALGGLIWRNEHRNSIYIEDALKVWTVTTFVYTAIIIWLV